jgi:hypothetical protein
MDIHSDQTRFTASPNRPGREEIQARPNLVVDVFAIAWPLRQRRHSFGARIVPERAIGSSPMPPSKRSGAAPKSRFSIGPNDWCVPTAAAAIWIEW